MNFFDILFSILFALWVAASYFRPKSYPFSMGPLMVGVMWLAERYSQSLTYEVAESKAQGAAFYAVIFLAGYYLVRFLTQKFTLSFSFLEEGFGRFLVALSNGILMTMSTGLVIFVLTNRFLPAFWDDLSRSFLFGPLLTFKGWLT